MAHTKDIKDLKWLPSYGEGEEILFASCSEDGDTKIWSLEDNCTPLHTFSPTKVNQKIDFFCKGFFRLEASV